MTAPTLLAKSAMLMLSDKKNRKIVLLLIFMPLLLIMCLVAFLPVAILSAILLMLNPTGDELLCDPYYIAINKVAAQYDIVGEISVPLVKSIDLIYSGDLSQDISYTVPFVQEHFISSYEVEETVQTGVAPDGTPTYSTERHTVYSFISATEMLDKVQHPPYNFTAMDISLIQEMFFDMEGGLGMEYDGAYPMPVTGYISSGYGNRIDPLDGKYFLHPAVDIVPLWHSPVMTIAGGEVVAVVTDNVYGNNVTIKHSDKGHNFWTFSAHLSRVDVTVGQQVEQGQVIGLEGGDQKNDPNPGRTTGHHLHFEVWETSSRSGSVNPARYLKG